ncbi:MAG: ComF family protein [Alistipes sp.]|nr:ComF family protein [Alistipes sp.]
MSIVGSILDALRTLVIGDGCMICGGYAEDREHRVCTKCRISIPLTGYYLEEDNPIKERFSVFAPIQRASALYFYDVDPMWREVIHRCKYRGQWSLAYNMGRWYGAILRESGEYADIDVIVPIPLHPLKRLKRGYNQSYYVAKGISRELGVGVDNSSIKRIVNNPSQTTKSGTMRWQNVEHIFKLRHPERLQHKHILIVDDVLTTGATIASCITAIYGGVAECRISIASLATPREKSLL